MCYSHVKFGPYSVCRTTENEDKLPEAVTEEPACFSWPLGSWSRLQGPMDKPTLSSYKKWGYLRGTLISE